MAVSSFALAAEGEHARNIDYPDYPAAPAEQTQAEADTKSAGCVSCHTKSDAATMHNSPAIVLGCTDCHGGSAEEAIPAGPYTDETYAAARDKAHVQPRFPKAWHYPASANPKRSYTLLNSEAEEFVRFTNPGLILVGAGADFDITPKLRASVNVNQLWFDKTEVLEAARNHGNIPKDIGQDISLAVIYRPLTSQNIIVRVSASALIPGGGYERLFGDDTPFSVLANLILSY